MALLAFLVSLLLSFLLPPVHAWLNSSGTAIVSTATRDPVRLRCVNWYGAHMEGFVAVGLDKRSCGAISDSIVSIGANCVRIPLSVELVVLNPAPNASAIAGIDRSQCNVSTALDVLDCQVSALTQRGLMVVLNNHVSFAGWVGAGETVPQGLWHSARFPTRDWVASLASLAARYRRNELVVGIDIRNEIHDQDGTVITWGKTDDPDSDWKAATVLADAAIRGANPDVLVIVSGLCMSYDLRAMQDLDNYRSKYVFTTHVYTFSWWFTDVNWMLILSLSLVFIAANLAVILCLCHKQQRLRQYIQVRKQRPTWSYVVAGAVLLPVYALVVSLVWIHEAEHVGCSSIAEDANATLYLGIVGLVAVALAYGVLATHENVMCWGRLLKYFCLWNVCLGTLQLGLCVFYQTYWAVLWDLRRWHSSSIPVWVGEFGTVVGDTSVAWGWLMRYIRDMHYAYWPLNGCSQSETFMETFMNVSNGYGILQCDSSTIRNVNWTRTIFPMAI